MPSVLKGRDEKGQIRNKHDAFKARVRGLIPVGASDDVLDLFAGDGLMFRRLWCRAGRGACCDKDRSCAELAARERNGWTVLRCDVDAALRAGLWRDRCFSVIDVDCYGSPWKFLAAMFSRPRELASPCTLILTDNYMSNRNISRDDYALGFRKPGTADEYLMAVDRMLAKALGGRDYDRRLYRQAKCVQHFITIS